MRKKIGELLIEAGAVTEEQVRKALGQQRAFGQGQRLGEVLVALGYVTPKVVARALARQFDLPFVELPEIPPVVSGLVARDFQEKHRLVPFRLEMEGRSERVFVAVVDPCDLAIVDALRFKLRKTLRVCVAASDDVERALAHARGDTEEVVEAISLDDATDPELHLDQHMPGMVQGNWFGERSTPPPPPPPPSAALAMDWELPAGVTEAEPETSPAPRAASARPPPSPPPPPPVPASEDLLEDLLGGETPAAPEKPRVPIVVFGGAAQGVTPPPPPPRPDFSDEDLEVLNELERLSQGSEPLLDTEKVKPARMVASLIRLLIRKRVISELEFLEELSRK